MVKSEIISAMNANRLYWMGRYEERVYMTLHLLRKCYDKMIDGIPSDYATFWHKLDSRENYGSNEEFTLGMMYDEMNTGSVLSAQLRAMDNAILLREVITSETLSYMEMSIALMRKCKVEKVINILELQPVTDWSLAFWGCADQRILNHKVLALMLMGRNIENIDIQLRFNYPFERLLASFKALKKVVADYPEIVDDNIMGQLDKLFTKETFDVYDYGYKNKVLSLINVLIRV